jgi:CheY-like chemotaxis protein
LTQLVKAYLSGENQTLADMQSMFAQAQHESAAPPGEGVISRPRVLLVDTSRATLEMCVALLNELGVHDITTVGDGFEALGRLLKEPFQAVITSLHVPTIDGQCLMPVLRTIPGPNQLTPVVLLTASVDALDPAAARPDYVVEKNPQMTQRLKKILSELKAAPERDAPPAGAKIDRVLKKIVLVDDSPAIHQLLRLSFKRFPEIAIAGIEDPTGALDFLRQEQPDLVLLDLNMPQLSGKEVIRAIKAALDLKEIPVAFFTAADSADERRELCDLGAWQVFKKPFAAKTFSADLISMFQAR